MRCKVFEPRLALTRRKPLRITQLPHPTRNTQPAPHAQCTGLNRPRKWGAADFVYGLRMSRGLGFARRVGELRDSKRLSAGQRETWFEYFASHPKIEYA